MNQNTSMCPMQNLKLHRDRCSCVQDLVLYIPSSGCWFLFFNSLHNKQVIWWVHWCHAGAQPPADEQRIRWGRKGTTTEPQIGGSYHYVIFSMMAGQDTRSKHLSIPQQDVFLHHSLAGAGQDTGSRIHRICTICDNCTYKRSPGSYMQNNGS